jgi:serine/threonine-protein kinase
MVERDQNLLFGILASQLKMVDPAQFAAAAAAWTLEPSRNLSQHLVESGVMSPRSTELVTAFVATALQAHDNNASAALDSFGGAEEVHRIFGDAINVAQTDGTQASPAEPQPMSDREMETISAMEESPGRYSHGTEYARGGMGRILLVQDEYLKRQIVLKELLSHAEPEESTIVDSPARLSASNAARFLQEARITGQLEHPSIVPVYELGRRKN